MLLLTAGPANITERVRRAMTLPDIGHREPEFSELLLDIRQDLLNVSGVSGAYTSVILGGSGTTGIEAAITSLRGVARNVLILANGVYGQRAAEIARIFGVPHTLVEGDWTRPVDAQQAVELLATGTHDIVYLIHHETTAGVLNRLRDVAKVAKARGAWVLVDAVSSVAGEVLDLAGWGIDLIVGSANKCIRGVPGAAFVILSRSLVAHLQGRQRVAYSTDLITAWERQEGGEPPFTPPIQVLFALREALRELREEGVPSRIRRYKEIACMLRDGLEQLGLTLAVDRSAMANTMTSVAMPAGRTYADLHRLLKERGYVIYKSQGTLAEHSFRLGTVGVVTPGDVGGFLAALKDTVNR